MPDPSRLLGALDEVGAVVESAAHLLLFLDFDGTLAPIVESPSLARLPEETRALMAGLARRPDCTVSVISGRALDDVRERVGIDGLVYAGNHGLEISGGGLHFHEATTVGLLDEIAADGATLTARLGHLAGVLVESKGATVSVHYRLARVQDHTEIERIVRAAIPADHPHFVVAPGKMVWEVRPRVDWNKGAAVRWIRQQLGLEGAVTIYLGDDRTDEDAFAEVGRFVTARVGAVEPTRAGFRLADTDEVVEFLRWVARLLQVRDLPRAS